MSPPPGIPLEWLAALDEQVHEHLRDTDAKRDRLWEGYVKTVVTVFSGLVALESFLAASAGGHSMALLLSVTAVLGLVLLFGVTVYLGVINARKWHAEYMNVHAIVQVAVRHGILDPNRVPDARREPFCPSTFSSRVYLVTQIANTAILLAIGYWWWRILAAWWILVLTPVVALGLAMALSFHGRRVLRNAEQRFWQDPFQSWLLAGLDVSDGISGTTSRRS